MTTFDHNIGECEKKLYNLTGYVNFEVGTNYENIQYRVIELEKIINELSNKLTEEEHENAELRSNLQSLNEEYNKIFNDLKNAVVLFRYINRKKKKKDMIIYVVNYLY